MITIFKGKKRLRNKTILSLEPKKCQDTHRSFCNTLRYPCLKLLINYISILYHYSWTTYVWINLILFLEYFVNQLSFILLFDLLIFVFNSLCALLKTFSFLLIRIKILLLVIRQFICYLFLGILYLFIYVMFFFII